MRPLKLIQHLVHLNDPVRVAKLTYRWLRLNRIMICDIEDISAQLSSLPPGRAVSQEDG